MQQFFYAGPPEKSGATQSTTPKNRSIREWPVGLMLCYFTDGYTQLFTHWQNRVAVLTISCDSSLWRFRLSYWTRFFLAMTLFSKRLFLNNQTQPNALHVLS
jgi:hypothetical protein